MGGYPIPGLGWGGYPVQVWIVGGYPGQVWMVEGYPSSQVWMVGGYPIPGLDGGGYPGTPPPSRPGWGTPPPSRLAGVPPTSIASTCYMVGRMPLAFTQEDLLVAGSF